ncbi:diguanylate cyclase [Catellatospora sp. KI3]|uniref:bifunctional diguanylate cyclase/phosphohydrolase n=1 Tax=Catellatospora sp. KI3 TaxID=3041620 RepID=UPI002482F804|nr:diguanylate cyclase [Catellatospora sp. KI3]MDI1460652.1 diguanylate cyclase [Catellatospora sp. KI3]
MRRSWVSPAGGDRVLAGFALGCVAWLAAFATLTYAAADSPNLARFVGEIVYLVPMVVLVGLSLWAARSATGRLRTAWRLLFAANLLWLVGDVIWAVLVYTVPEGPPIPSPADACYLLRYTLTITAIVLGVGLKVRKLLDALLVAAAAAAIGWQLIIAPLVPQTWNASDFVTFLYPVCSVIIVSMLAALMLAGPSRVPFSMVLVGAAFGVAAVLDAVYAYTTVLNPYTSSTWLNVGWQVEVLLLCVAALAAVRHVGEERPPVAEVSFLPALVAVLIVGCLALGDLILVGQVSRVTLSLAMLLLVGLLIRQIAAARERVRLTEQLRTAAITDSLTGLHNRRFFEETLAAETAEHRDGDALSLILLDLDHFKAVNDTHGHLVGDAVLAEVASRIRRCLRATDLACRYGGEEFVCLLPRTDAPTALDLAERIRTAVRSAPVTVAGVAEPLTLTASLGVASAEAGDGEPKRRGEDLVAEADRALYRAKALGRDRVLEYGPSDQIEADPPYDLPQGLLWLADQADRVNGLGTRGAAVSRWAWQTAARLDLDQAVRLATAAAARVQGLGGICLDCVPAGPDRADSACGRPARGARLLADLAQRPDLAPLIAACHERFDGTGHPRGLAGPDIPVGARIIAVCDAWSAVRPGGSPSAPGLAAARLALSADRGTRLDPEVVDAFLALLDAGAVS